jgi:hypothetical protein
MFNSTIFDVVVGLISLFLAVSLVTSALTEAISALIGLRAKTLLAGIKQLLNDPDLNGLARDLYNHALVNPLSDGKTQAPGVPTVKPSYINAQHFALALIDSIQQPAGQTATLEESINKIDDAQIKAGLAALYRRVAGDADAFRDQVAQWFDSAMGRLSGTYKRWTNLIAFVLALLTAGLLNADPIHLADTLWERPALAAQMAKLQLPNTIDPSQPAQEALPLLQQIEGAGPLLGWNDFANDPRSSGGRLVVMLLSWLITAGAALFGAPFWFDVLQRFVQLRGTGQPVGPKGS